MDFCAVERKTPMFSLQDKVALVTGASQGIGRATSLTLFEAGAKVAVAARSASLRWSMRRRSAAARVLRSNDAICAEARVARCRAVASFSRSTTPSGSVCR